MLDHADLLQHLDPSALAGDQHPYQTEDDGVIHAARGPTWGNPPLSCTALEYAPCSPIAGMYFIVRSAASEVGDDLSDLFLPGAPLPHLFGYLNRVVPRTALSRPKAPEAD